MTNGGTSQANAKTSTSASPTDEYLSDLPNPSTLENLITEFPEELIGQLDERYVDTSGSNAWYPFLEKFVSTLSNECLRHSSMHADSSKLYNKYYQYITLSLIFVPLLSGVITLMPFGGTVMKIIQGTLALILTALGALNKMMKFSEKSHLHRLASNKYMKLNGQISEQLFLPMDKRYNGIQFERFCRQVFFSIKEFAPYPNKRFSKQIKMGPETPAPTPIPVPIPIPAPAPSPGQEEAPNVPIESIPLQALPEQARRKYLEDRGRRLGVFMGEHDSPIV